MSGTTLKGDDQACEVPLVELLRNVPKDFSIWVPCQWAEDGRETGHRRIPVAHLMNRAANEIERLSAPIREGNK